MQIGYYLLGIVFVALYISTARKISPGLKQELGNYAFGLVVAAFIYIGFALWGKASDWYATELIGIAIYGTFAWLGYKYAYWFLGIGWFLHIFWDISLHMQEQAHFVPEWYPPACLSFDLVLAAYIIWRKQGIISG